jgi:hypothetical protein
MVQRETMFLDVFSPRSLLAFPGQASRYYHLGFAHAARWRIHRNALSPAGSRLFLSKLSGSSAAHVCVDQRVEAFRELFSHRLLAVSPRRAVRYQPSWDLQSRRDHISLALLSRRLLVEVSRTSQEVSLCNSIRSRRERVSLIVLSQWRRVVFP